MATASIVPKPVDPDEFLVQQGNVFAYSAKVVHSIRFMDGQSIKTVSNVYLGSAESV